MRMIEERIHRGKLDRFSYDWKMRLINAKLGIEKNNPDVFEKQLSYLLDLVDNIRRITETKDSTTTTIETTINNRNQYTKFGNLNLSYDSNGNLKQKGNKNFTYDYKNQLVKVQDPDKTVEFRYDPFGRRIQKKVELKNSQSSQITNYYYEGYRVIEERDGSDNLKKQYIYGSGIDELLRMDIYENQTPTPYYLHHNLIGSVTGITDENGNLIELIEYDPYGKPYFLKPTGNPENPYSIQNESTIGNTYLFQGREFDPETGLYYFRARYYDPEIGRFLQPDPKGYVDSMNLYQAFNCNPINFIDPFGFYWMTITITTPQGAKSITKDFSAREYMEYLFNQGYSLEEAVRLMTDIGGWKEEELKWAALGVGADFAEAGIKKFLEISAEWALSVAGGEFLSPILSVPVRGFLEKGARLLSEGMSKIIGKKVMIKTSEKTVGLTTSVTLDVLEGTIRQSIEDIQKGEFSGIRRYTFRIEISIFQGRIEDLIKTKLLFRKTKLNSIDLSGFKPPIPKSRAIVPVSKGNKALVLFRK
jgi:RHS repeat-associated protein